MQNFSVRQAVAMQEGDGARVQRLFPVNGFMNYDPFMLWDHFEIQPGSGFPVHPHRGFEAITYLFEGAMQHDDNLGNHSIVAAGGAQLFTAGRGFSHSEMPAAEGPTRGIQLWINLPRRLKGIDPGYQAAESLPARTVGDATVHVIIGDESPLRLQSAIDYCDVNLPPDGAVKLSELTTLTNGLIYVVSGELTIAGTVVAAGQAGFFNELQDQDIVLTGPARFMLCAGMPYLEPVRQYGPFVD